MVLGKQLMQLSQEIDLQADGQVNLELLEKVNILLLLLLLMDQELQLIVILQLITGDYMVTKEKKH